MNPLLSPLLTDLYQLTMLQTYIELGMEDTAVFECFVRKLPAERNFLVAAGLEQVLDFLEQLHFSPDELEWLSQHFPPHVIRYLENLRFTGDVHALPEGTAFFPHEPLVRITAPLPQAQLVESRLINLLNFQSMIASKAARCVIVAPGKALVDFGFRRTHGAEAGLLAARASYLAGFAGTATVLAGKMYDIPLFGTMAHSFIQAHVDETAAFEHFAHSHPKNVTLLIDTYDTLAAAHKVTQLAPRLREEGITVKAVRIDSGDLAEEAKRVRQILDDGGCPEIGIFATASLDEYRVSAILARGAPINGFGIGTSLTTSSDAPYLDSVYKLQEYAGTPRRKRAEGKVTWPGRKQVYRSYNDQGQMQFDTLALEHEGPPDGEPLLQLVMQNGKRLAPASPLADARQRARITYGQLPADLRQLTPAVPYPVHCTTALRELARQADREQQKSVD